MADQKQEDIKKQKKSKQKPTNSSSDQMTEKHNSNQKNRTEKGGQAKDQNIKKIKDTLPVIMVKFKLVMPNQHQNIKLADYDNIKTIMYAVDHENSQVLLVLERKGDNKNNKTENQKRNNMSVKNVYPTAIFCEIKNKLDLYNQDPSVKELYITGINRVRITNLFKVEGIIKAEYKMLNDIIPTKKYAAVKIIRKIAELISTYYSKKIQIPAEIMSADFQCNNNKIKTFLYGVAYSVSIKPEELQYIFDEDHFEKRVLKILKILQLRIKEIEIDKKIEDKINENITKTQKEFYLREKIKVIRDELGDRIDKKCEGDRIKAEVEKRDIPQVVKEKIFAELTKYADTSPFSSENSVIKTYIDWLVDLPWDRKTDVKIDIPRAYSYLNSSHHGLEKSKQRIIEELAVQLKIKSKHRAAIICFIGPPGVGKTSLARSIATVTNRRFMKISLGGIKDESEIRGHRRTYVGAMPGRIIQVIKKAKVRNPLILLDEIDKMSSDMRGDPASAMLEVLDPEQNKYFSDNYIEENFDLSDVMFVATANNISQIPSALRDRLEIIHLHSYTEHEKYEISTRFLIPRLLKKNGLKKQNIKISKRMMLKIIFNYTMESGVRQLERELDTICRKIVVQLIVKGNNKSTITITNKNLDKYLGIIKYDYTKKNKKSLPGSVTGLAWTQYGGDILPIEVSMCEGQGKLEITGNLGDVMKESVQISLSFIKSNAQRFKIQQKVFQKFDIHLHVPEGAIPKDGPSAGITITSSLLSLFKNKAINSSIAMTGEITLLGNVLEIGGLKEKLISAVRSRLKTVFIPRGNIKDLQEIPQEILKSLIIYPVENYKEIYRHLFGLNHQKTFKLQELVTTNFLYPNIFTNINIKNLLQ